MAVLRKAPFKTEALGLLLAATVVWFSVPAAFAAETHEAIGSFCAPTGIGAPPCEPSFGKPSALAVDQSDGDLLVVDLEDQTLHRFKSNGEPDLFSAIGSNVIDGHAGGEDATPEGEILSTEIAGSPIEAEVAVAPPGSAGSTAGDIYVTDAFNEVVDIFESNGKYIGQLSGASAGYSCGVAVDSKGTVYVGDYFVGIHKLVPSAPATFGTPTDFAFPKTCQIAAGAKSLATGGSEGFVFPVQYGGGVAKVDSEGTEEGEEEYAVSSASTTTVAVNPESGHILTAAGSALDEFDVSGSANAVPVSNTAAAGGLMGIAVDGASGDVYASGESSQVAVFGPPVPLLTATTNSADGITAATATLHGTVEPQGKQITDCHFEYGTTTLYGQTAPCVPAAASIPGDSSDHSVSAVVNGLDPATTYHFRLVAENAVAASEGIDRTFRTRGPLLVAQSIDSIGLSEANVSAKVDPNGEATTYHVEYGPTASYGQSTPESAPIGFEGDESEHAVSVHIGGLEAGTAYHFRFVATNAGGTGSGPDTTFSTYSAPPTFAPCPDGSFRTGFGAALPDCRAYEQATPTDKHGANAQGKVNGIQASSAGDRVTFFLDGGLPASGGSSRFADFLASRGPGGWSSDGMLPLTDPRDEAQIMGWSEDLSRSAVIAPGPSGGDIALYLRDNATAAFQPGPSGFAEYQEPALAGYADDNEHLIFESNSGLLPGAPAGFFSLYDLDHGSLNIAARIPVSPATHCDDVGGPACVVAPEGSAAGAYNWNGAACTTGAIGGAACLYYTQLENTISRDGSKVFFTSGGTRRLYMREDGIATIQVSASQRTTPDPNGEKPAAFMAATPTGSTVFFTSCEKLTDDSTAVSTGENECTTSNQGQDLYSYDTGTGELSDLTVDANVSDPNGAAVQGVLGISADGSYAYFAAKGALAPGASPAECGFGACNLYVAHDGVVTFIARLGSDFRDWLPGYETGPSDARTSRVAANGVLLFSSDQSLTGYGNAGNQELFRYSPGAEEPVCVSCNPTGAPPVSKAKLQSRASFIADAPHFGFLTRNISADGRRIFFESTDALVSSDTNGVSGCPEVDSAGNRSCQDVYEWEAKGSGSCESESQNGGCIYLISSGTSSDPSFFADASSNGDHAFIFTSQQLVPADRDELVDVYDAGVGAGLASQHSLTPPTCSGTACQANPPPPPEQGTASSTFSGGGNAHPRPNARKCPKGRRKVRRRGKTRCAKHQGRKSHHKRANDNRGGSK